MRQPGFEPESPPWQGDILTRLNYYRNGKEAQNELYKDYCSGLSVRIPNKKQKGYKEIILRLPMETITIQKKKYEKLKKLAGKEELSPQEIKEWKATL